MHWKELNHCAWLAIWWKIYIQEQFLIWGCSIIEVWALDFGPNNLAMLLWCQIPMWIDMVYLFIHGAHQHVLLIKLQKDFCFFYPFWCLNLFMNLTNMDDCVMVVWVWDGGFFFMWHGVGKQLALHWAKFLKRIWVQFPYSYLFSECIYSCKLACGCKNNCKHPWFEYA